MSKQTFLSHAIQEASVFAQIFLEVGGVLIIVNYELNI